MKKDNKKENNIPSNKEKSNDLSEVDFLQLLSSKKGEIELKHFSIGDDSIENVMGWLRNQITIKIAAALQNKDSNHLHVLGDEILMLQKVLKQLQMLAVFFN